MKSIFSRLFLTAAVLFGLSISAFATTDSTVDEFARQGQVSQKGQSSTDSKELKLIKTDKGILSPPFTSRPAPLASNKYFLLNVSFESTDSAGVKSSKNFELPISKWDPEASFSSLQHQLYLAKVTNSTSGSQAPIAVTDVAITGIEFEANYHEASNSFSIYISDSVLEGFDDYNGNGTKFRVPLSKVYSSHFESPMKDGESEWIPVLSGKPGAHRVKIRITSHH